MRASLRVLPLLLLALAGGGGCLAALFGPANPLAIVRTVQSLMELRDLSRDELIERLQMAPEAILEDMVYGKLEGLTRVYDAAKHPAQFFYEGQALALAVVEDPSTLVGITADALTQHFGAPSFELPTAVGDAARLAVYPGTGLSFAFADPQQPVSMLEVFPKTTRTAYESSIWRAPAVPSLAVPDAPAAPSVAVPDAPPVPSLAVPDAPAAVVPEVLPDPPVAELPPDEADPPASL
jgi:hypothetical protein